MYVDDLNIIRTHREIPKIVNYLKKEFQMKDLGKNKILSRPVDRAFSIWNSDSSINLHRECH